MTHWLFIIYYSTLLQFALRKKLSKINLCEWMLMSWFSFKGMPNNNINLYYTQKQFDFVELWKMIAILRRHYLQETKASDQDNKTTVVRCSALYRIILTYTSYSISCVCQYVILFLKSTDYLFFSECAQASILCGQHNISK